MDTQSYDEPYNPFRQSLTLFRYAISPVGSSSPYGLILNDSSSCDSWPTTSSCAIARSFWTRVDHKRYIELVAFGRAHLYLVAWYLESSSNEHPYGVKVLWKKASRVRIMTLSCNLLYSSELTGIEISRLNRCLIGSRRFVDISHIYSIYIFSTYFGITKVRSTIAKVWFQWSLSQESALIPNQHNYKPNTSKILEI